MIFRAKRSRLGKKVTTPKYEGPRTLTCNFLSAMSKASRNVKTSMNYRKLPTVTTQVTFAISELAAFRSRYFRILLPANFLDVTLGSYFRLSDSWKYVLRSQGWEM